MSAIFSLAAATAATPCTHIGLLHGAVRACCCRGTASPAACPSLSVLYWLVCFSWTRVWEAAGTFARAAVHAASLLTPHIEDSVQPAVGLKLRLPLSLPTGDAFLAGAGDGWRRSPPPSAQPRPLCRWPAHFVYPLPTPGRHLFGAQTDPLSSACVQQGVVGRCVCVWVVATKARSKPGHALLCSSTYC